MLWYLLSHNNFSKAQYIIQQFDRYFLLNITISSSQTTWINYLLRFRQPGYLITIWYHRDISLSYSTSTSFTQAYKPCYYNVYQYISFSNKLNNIIILQLPYFIMMRPSQKTSVSSFVYTIVHAMLFKHISIYRSQITVRLYYTAVAVMLRYSNTMMSPSQTTTIT
jgi:hypothetical protein